MRKTGFLALLLLAGCASYDPPVAGDHHAAKYRAEAAKRASQVANAAPSSTIRSLFASDQPEHDDEIACMVRRGYPRQGRENVCGHVARSA